MRPAFTASFCLLLALASAGLTTDEPPAGKAPDRTPPTDKELAGKRMAFMKGALERFTIRVGDRKDAAAAAAPCLRWSDPVSNSADGVVAVYAHNGGRPDAVAQFFLNAQKKWVAEFTIVPDGGVTILRSGRELWKPAEYVCKFADLPGSPVPAARAAARPAQMREIAAQFSVTDYFGTDEVKQDLRLLPRPVYRYAGGAIEDGAVFVFAHGTNPECCVLIEAARDGTGLRYRYAVAPMSIYRLEARYKDAVVWSVERRHPGRKAVSYYADVYTPEPGESLPE